MRVWLLCYLREHFGGNFNSHTREGVTLSTIISSPASSNFNSHTREGVTQSVKHRLSSDIFQLTHPWGCDTVPSSLNERLPKFQLTHPWGCDLLVPLLNWLVDISTHTPVRVWQSPLCNCFCRSIFQLTHPWGCDGLMVTTEPFVVISTHTPVRVWLNRGLRVIMWAISTHTPVRVWRRIVDIIEPLRISTHTPVRVWPRRGYLHQQQSSYFNSHTREGVTIVCLWKTLGSKFQLTHPWGCDALSFGKVELFLDISTHTPVRVWHHQTNTPNGHPDFNSHTREGVTNIYCKSFKKTQGFQLTHPWGCDVMKCPLFLAAWISTHTPVRVWHSALVCTAIICTFQLTHPWGCDLFLKNCLPCLMNFNSHTREGVTLPDNNTVPFVQFQLTHPWGCDAGWTQTTVLWCYFNSHTREGVTISPMQSWHWQLFQLTHPWGCDSALLAMLVFYLISTHTPVRVWQLLLQGQIYP